MHLFIICSNSIGGIIKRPVKPFIGIWKEWAMLRALNAKLVVKVIDACSSGNRLIKSDTNIFSSNAKGINNLIQIAACMDSQVALGGPSLSPFTEAFRNATLQNESGPVYYTDIRNYLRDEYIRSHETGQPTPGRCHGTVRPERNNVAA